MTGVDTNVLVRYLTGDEPREATAARGLLEGQTAHDGPFRLAPPVLCELVWVLRAAYDIDKPAVVSTLERVVATAQFEIGDRDLVLLAIEDYRRGRGDFADYLVGRQNQAHGCGRTATFDRKLSGHELFAVLRPTR